MKRTLICTLSEHVGAIAKVQGFITTIRDQKSLIFMILEDRTGMVQIVCDKASIVTEGLSIGSAITATGKVVLAPQVKQGAGVEIQAQQIIVESQAETPLPIAADSGSDKKLDWRFLHLRDTKERLIFEVKTTLLDALRAYWAQEHFIEIHSPKLMGTASESGAEVFEVKYFDQKAYLAQSPQFYKQMAIAAGFERIFEIGPVFRAEPSFTSRHATEYISIDMEIGWVDDLTEIMRVESEMLAFALQRVKDKHGETIKEHFGVDVVVPVLPFPVITLQDAREILKEQGHIIAHKDDLDPAGERLLSRYAMQHYGHEFIFVTDYPAQVRAFYHRRHMDDPTLTHSFDLLWKGLEITTGALREHRLDRLTQQATEKGMSLEPISDYLDFFRYGCPPHGGCGIGLERVMMLLLGVDNIRDVAYLFRGPNRLTP
jgi:nondiscriminating aspartyl-tRNA synthetase